MVQSDAIRWEYGDQDAGYVLVLYKMVITVLEISLAIFVF
jgi:hypothetical protein